MKRQMKSENQRIVAQLSELDVSHAKITDEIKITNINLADEISKVK